MYHIIATLVQQWDRLSDYNVTLLNISEFYCAEIVFIIARECKLGEDFHNFDNIKLAQLETDFA